MPDHTAPFLFAAKLSAENPWAAAPADPVFGAPNNAKPGLAWPSWRELSSEFSRTYNPWDPRFSEPARDGVEYALRAGARGAGEIGRAHV